MKLSRHIELEKILNCRDLGGIVNKDGKTIKSHMIFRSNLLMDATKNDEKTLLEEGLTDVLDFRGDREAGAYPDVIIPGVTYHHLPMHVLCREDWSNYKHYPHVSYKTENDQMDYLQEWFYVYADCSADILMATSYAKAVSRLDMQEQWTKMFKLLLNVEGGLLFHCQDGKDRTGVAAMLILELLKVDDSIIRDEYVLSKKYLHEKIEKDYQQALDHHVPEPVLTELKKIQGSEYPWIDGAIREFHELGGYPTYFTKYLGLTDEEIKAIQDKYLE